MFTFAIVCLCRSDDAIFKYRSRTCRLSAPPNPLEDAMRQGKLDYIMTGAKHRSYVIVQLEKLMRECWHTKPSERPTIFEVMDRLAGLLTSVGGEAAR